jgi:hypothetical protein
MAKGKKPKKLTVATPVDHAKLLKQFEEEQRIQLEAFYKKLALIKRNIDRALTQVGFIDECENLSQAAFKAGRAYGPLDRANDDLEEMLNEMCDNNDLDDWNYIYDKN